MNRTHRWIGAIALGMLVSGIAGAQSHAQMVQPVADAKWGPAPPFIPAGAQIAVLSGDPGKAAPYTVRLKFPANYAIQAHSHPTDENVTIVSGALYMGMGDKLDKKATTALTVGGFAQVPANTNHFVYTTQETTILLYGIGPVEFKYANPKDDPRSAARNP